MGRPLLGSEFFVLPFFSLVWVGVGVCCRGAGRVSWMVMGMMERLELEMWCEGFVVGYRGCEIFL